MYQVLQHALAQKDNKTRFTLIFANVTPADILLKDQFDAWKKTYPDTFNVVYTVDKAEGDWAGPVGYVNKELIQKHIAPASLGEKVKVFICGPPGQVAAIAGKKDGMKQGTLAGTLKELGYTEDQVRPPYAMLYARQVLMFVSRDGTGVQVLDGTQRPIARLHGTFWTDTKTHVRPDLECCDLCNAYEMEHYLIYVPIHLRGPSLCTSIGPKLLDGSRVQGL